MDIDGASIKVDMMRYDVTICTVYTYWRGVMYFFSSSRA